VSSTANEVEITITGKDLSGPAFASAIAHVAELKAAARGLQDDLSDLSMPGLDSSEMQTSLLMLKSKLQSLRIADIADINVQPGLIMTQLNLLKRLIQQAGISDILDIDVNQANLTRALSNISSLSENIPVNFDIQGLDALKDALAAESAGLSVPVTYKVSGPGEPVIGGETVPVIFKPDFAAVNAELAALSHTTETIPVKFSVENMPSLLVGEDNIPVIFKPDLAALDAAIAAVSHETETIPVKLEVEGGTQLGEGVPASVLASWAALNDETTKYGSGLGLLIPMIEDLGSILGGGLLAAALSNQKVTSALSSVWTSFIAGLAAGKAQVAQVGSNLLGLGVTAVAAINGFKGLSVAGGGWTGRLQYTIPIIGLTIKSVAGFHVALDSLAEALIAVGLSVAAATPAILVMANVGEDLVTHFTAVHDVTESLGIAIPPLTGKFDDLARAMAPQTIEAFGGAMELINGRVGLFTEATEKVVNVFDTWIAKIDIFASGQGLNKFLSSGIGYMQQFATFVGDVGIALGNLLTRDPGVAHYLLDIIDGVAKLLDLFTGLPAPIVETVLALHGLYVWASVIAPLLLSAVGAIAKMGVALAGLFANPWTWAVIGAAAIAYLVVEFGQADEAVRSFISNINTQVSNDNATSAILDIASAVGQLTQQINQAGSSQGLAQIKANWGNLGNTASDFSADAQAAGHAWLSFTDAIGGSLESWANLYHTILSLGNAFKNTFWPGAGASIVATNNIKAFNKEIQNLIAQQGNLFRTAGTLVTQGFSLAQAFALEDLAGVKASDTLAVMAQKISNLITGYKDMSVQGGILSNSVNAITFASLQQQSDISSLTQGWDAFFKVVTGGESGLVGFLQQTSGLYQSLGAGSASLSVSNGHASISFKSLAAAADSTAVSMTGTNTASLNAREAFLSSASAAQQEADNLITLASAGGEGSKGTDLVTSSIKDMVAELLPAAKNSADLTTVLYALAQQGGYQGADSFKALSGWVLTASGSIAAAKNPTQQLQGNITSLTTAAGNLTTDVQNLSIALGQDLTQAESAAILLAQGGTKPFNDFALAIKNTGDTSTTTKNAAITLGDELLAMANNNVSAAKTEFESFAIGGLGLTKTQADALWQDILNNGLPALGKAGSSAFDAQAAFVSWAHNGLNVGQSAAIDLWSEIVDHLGPTLSGLGNVTLPSSKAAFVSWAENALHLSQNQAHSLWSQLVTLQKQINSMHGTNIPVTVDANGYVNVNGYSISAGAYFSPHAAGGLIGGSGSPTADDKLIAVSTGEYVVKAAAVDKYGVGMMNAINAEKFASGGMVGTTGNLGIDFPQNVLSIVTDVIVAATTQIASTATKDFATYVAQQKSIIDAQRAAATAASTGAVLMHAGAAPSGSNEAVLEAVAAQHGWTGAQWQALYNVEMREAGFSLTATNPSSGAYGMAQFINGPSEYAEYGGNSTTAYGQAIAMCNYIAQRYGNPEAAWAHEQEYGWYDNGGWLKPGMTMAFNGTGRPEFVSPPGGQKIEVCLSWDMSSLPSGLDPRTLQAIRYEVRTKGGGSVQKAFGKQGVNPLW
jgi:hypothetical protein